MTGLKIVTTAMASASAFVMSTVMAAAMGGRSSRSESSYNLSSSGSSASGSSVGSGVGSSGVTPAGNTNVASVPEIDASTGLLAIAAVLAVIAFVWERNRRQRA